MVAISSAANSDRPTEPAPIPASLFGFDVLQKIGEGAASVIYAVSDPKTHQVYALKHVVKETEKHARQIEQLQNELEISKRFRHPALRKSYELRVKRRLLGEIVEAGLVMELVDAIAIDDRPPRDLAATIDVFIQTAQALAALHYQRIVHCDLKPGNILVSPDPRQVKLIDFGQACPFDTVKDRIQGTPDFIAPEQVKIRPMTPRTDVFSFGATLYWALTLRRIPTIYTVSKADRHVLINQSYPAPDELNAGVPPRLSRLVMDCVRIKPIERPQTMEEILTVLTAEAAG